MVYFIYFPSGPVDTYWYLLQKKYFKPAGGNSISLLGTGKTCLSKLLLDSQMSIVLATGNMPRWQQEIQASSLLKNVCTFLGCR